MSRFTHLLAARSLSPSPHGPLSTKLRGRMSSWIAGVVGAVCFAQAGILLLHATGILEQASLQDLERLPLLVLACCGSGALALLARHHFQRTPGSPATVLLSVGLAVNTGMAVPGSMLDLAVPQIVWMPTLVAAVTCDIIWIPGVTALTFAILLARHFGAPALSAPFAWVTAVGLTWLIWMVRWLHDAGIVLAEQAHERELHSRFHDSLTGLPNRQSFSEQLAIARAMQQGRPLTLLRLDLEQFGALTHALGREAGDAVLLDVAKHARDSVQRDAHVARIGADDFLLLLPDCDQDQAAAAAAALIARLEAPREFAARTVRLTPRVGVVVVDPADPTDGEGLLKRMEQAAADARGGGHRRHAGTTPSHAQDRVERTFQLGQALHGALERGELRIVYQPIACLRTGRFVEAEALLRWTSPTYGAVSPAEFIPLAEANGTIHPIGDWVLRQAAVQAKGWREAGAQEFRVSVNRSPVQFDQDDAGTDALACLEGLRSEGVTPECVTLEITEGVQLDADEPMRERFRALRAAGVAVALDDFGTGYASMAQLHTLDMDLVKIDRRFVSSLSEDSRERVLCESVIRMTHALGMKVVAEGIETAEQARILRGLGCDYGQGWLLGRPIPPEELGELLRAQRARTGRESDAAEHAAPEA